MKETSLISKSNEFSSISETFSKISTSIVTVPLYYCNFSVCNGYLNAKRKKLTKIDIPQDQESSASGNKEVSQSMAALRKRTSKKMI